MTTAASCPPSAPRPLVSVVIPTHNRSALLARSIRSVLAQTFGALEVIVVDDASTDDTAAVVQGFDDPRLHYVRLDQNVRAAAARNIGVRHSRGELIAFHDDDDIWLVRKLEKQVAKLLASTPDVGLCLCPHIRLAGGETTIKSADLDTLDFARGPLGGFAVIITPVWLLRRAVFDRAGGFNPDMRSWDDWEFAARLARICRFTQVDEPLVIQDRIQGGGMWKNAAVYANDMQIILRDHGELWTERPRLLARQHYTLGRSQVRFGETVDGRRNLIAAIRLHPLLWRAWLVYGASWLGSGLYGSGLRIRDRLLSARRRRTGDTP